MTGLDMLKSIRNLDADLIEEAEFATFQKGKAKPFGKKKLLFILAAALVVGTMTAAATFTRWTASLQFGNITGYQPSEKIKQQAEQSGLSVTPTEMKNGKQEAISATDNGVTVTVAQTVADQYGARVVFRIEGMELEKGQAPWAWWDYKIEGIDSEDLHMGWGTQFFDGMTLDDAGNPVYVKNGQPIPRVGENQQLLLDYQLADGSIEFIIDFSFPRNGESFFGKEMSVTFTGFGVQGEKFEDEDIMTVPGKWELSWTLEGSTEMPKKWTPNAKIGDWDVTLLEAEIGQYSMKIAYKIGDAYEDDVDFTDKMNWSPHPVSIRLKDGTDMHVFGYNGSGDWDPDAHTYTTVDSSLNTILDPEQIVGMSFYAGYDLNEQGYRVDRPYHYVPFE